MQRISIKALPSWSVIILAMLLGVLTGTLLGEHVSWRKYLGEIFISLIRMVVIPVIFVSLVCGVTAMRDMAQMRRIAWKTLSIYMVTMVLAATLAMTLANGFGIGTGLNYQAITGGGCAGGARSSSLLPANPVMAMAQGRAGDVVRAVFRGGH